MIESVVSFILGCLLGLPFSPFYDVVSYRFLVFLASLSVYHWAEYLYVCCFHYNTLSFDSNYLTITFKGFLLNHSKSYVIALTISFLEFFVLEYYIKIQEILPWIIRSLCVIIGLSMLLLGHYFRIGAEFTAGINFNHRI